MIPDSISTKELTSLLNQESEIREASPDVQREVEQWETARDLADQTYKALIEKALKLDLDTDAVLDRIVELVLADHIDTCDRLQAIEPDRHVWAEEKGKIQAMLTIWGTTRF